MNKSNEEMYKQVTRKISSKNREGKLRFQGIKSSKGQALENKKK